MWSQLIITRATYHFQSCPGLTNAKLWLSPRRSPSSPWCRPSATHLQGAVTTLPPATLLSTGGLASQLSSLLCPQVQQAASGPPPVWSDGISPLPTPSNRSVSFTADATAPSDLPSPICCLPRGSHAAAHLCPACPACLEYFPWTSLCVSHVCLC